MFGTTTAEQLVEIRQAILLEKNMQLETTERQNSSMFRLSERITVLETNVAKLLQVHLKPKE